MGSRWDFSSEDTRTVKERRRQLSAVALTRGPIVFLFLRQSLASERCRAAVCWSRLQQPGPFKLTFSNEAVHLGVSRVSPQAVDGE